MPPNALAWLAAAWLALQADPPRSLERTWADLIARANVALDLHGHWRGRLHRIGWESRPEGNAARAGLVREMDRAEEQWRARRWEEAARAIERASAWLVRLEREPR